MVGVQCGRIVAPGVTDIHTHYDAQIHWNPYCTGLSWHGTVHVIVGGESIVEAGNCTTALPGTILPNH